MGEEEKDYGEHEFAESFRGNIRRFLYQAGVPHERVGEIAERAIGEAKKELTDGANPQIILFRTAARMIEGTPDREEPEDLFRFEEDEQLHREIRDLPARIRLPLLLMRLHDFNPAEAGSICRMTADEVRTAEETGYRLLTEADPERSLDRQLSLLRRAYGRIRFQEFVADQPATPVLSGNKTEGSKGKRWWAAGAGLVAAMGLLVAAAFILPSLIGPVDAAYVKELGTRFDEEKARFQMKIGATDMEMQAFFSIEQARYEFQSLISQFEQAVKSGTAPQKKEAERAVDELMDEFDLPSEMIKDLRERPLTNDKIKSRTFLQRYHDRTHELSMIISSRFMEYQDYLKRAVHGGKFDEEEFLRDIDKYPEPLRHALQLMEQEGYEFTGEVWTIESQMYPVLGKTPALGEDAGKLEESVARLAVIGEELELALDSLGQNPEGVAEALNGLEELAVARDAGDQWTMPKDLAVDHFRELVFGGSTGRVFGEDGKVVPERRTIWKLIGSKSGTPSGELLGPVVQEMEQTGWKRSPAYNILTPDDYRYALMSARDGADREHNREVYYSVSLSDPEYQVRAETLYRDLSETEDRSLLEGETQVMIALLALLSADRKDGEMMALLSADGDPASVAALAEDGNLGVLEGGALDFQESAIEHNETGIRAPVYLFFGPANDRVIWLTYTPEGLWLIDRQDAP